MGKIISITRNHQPDREVVFEFEAPRPSGFGFDNIGNRNVNCEISMPGGALKMLEGTRGAEAISNSIDRYYGNFGGPGYYE